MIEALYFIEKGRKTKIDFLVKNDNKFEINCNQYVSETTTSFDIEIEFKFSIVQFRNHDYTWVDLKIDRIANEFSPKILKLDNDLYVQSNIFEGIWEVNKKDKRKLLWRFNPDGASPITYYLGNDNKKTILNSKQIFQFTALPTLLFNSKNAIEFSRSKKTFSAITVFTDHCDFDTLENLKLQRTFFKQNNIKITKGFFLNHFSKRNDNASYQNDASELLNWKRDGHELCYHSLSQSIKSKNESWNDFYNFKPPFPDLKTWIDHGYQPYNVSLLDKNKIDLNLYENNLKTKNISILWNYVDCGTATKGVVNQLNNNHFTLSKFLKGNNNLSLITKLQLMIKNIIFHYYGDENLILKYKKTATDFKKLIYNNNVKSIFSLIKNFFQIGFDIFKVILFWNKSKNKSYKYAKYNPILFKHTILNNEFYFFQTLEMIDFKKSLCKNNIDELILEKGVFIAHTYFSVPMKYHQGKFFKNENEIDENVSKNFHYLGNKIKNNEIWNPTLIELTNYWSNFEKIILDVNLEGELIVKNNSNLIFREIN
ncbi:hypothetical protein [Flavobacterium sp.]|uniref:hypothetical protein n=1 Tax=Flavobacterium sp. TaxID=239 RepID=UPI0037522B96